MGRIGRRNTLKQKEEAENHINFRHNKTKNKEEKKHSRNGPEHKLSRRKRQRERI